METIAKKSRLWLPAWLAAARYVAYNMVLSYSVWHAAVKDNWASLTSWDVTNVGCAVVLSMLTALGAVMNGSWEKAKEQEIKTL